MMRGLEGDQDLRVRAADRAAVAVGEIDATGREANIIENAGEICGRYVLENDAFNLIGEGGGRFDSRARLCTHVQTDLARVDRREEVLAAQWNNDEAHGAQ